MRFIRLSVFRVLPVLIVILPVAFLFVILEKTPAIPKTKAVGVEDAERAQLLAKRMKKSSNSAFISTSEDDLNALVAFLSRGINWINGHASITPAGLEATLTLRIPSNPIGDYLNLKVQLYPSESGRDIARVFVGRVEIPGSLAMLLLRLIIDLSLGESQGAVIIDSVQNIVFNGNTVTITIHFKPTPDLKVRLKKLKDRLEGIRGKIQPLGDPETVRVYYSKLIEIEQRIDLSKPVSLARFMGPLFDLAGIRSTSNNAVDENRAAILALAIYAGDWRFERLIGSMRTAEMKSTRRRAVDLVLGGRQDLRLHFVISAGMGIVTDTGISQAIGEFKELMDTVRGGSGFSFVDLAADRAGVRFAEVATGRAEDARRLQVLIAREPREYVFFPHVSELPEKISQAEFEHLYGNVESSEYKERVEKIDQLINQLPIYRKSKVVYRK